MLVTTEDVAKATGVNRVTVLRRIRAAEGKLAVAKVGGEYLLSSEEFPPVLRTVIEGYATARLEHQTEARRIKAMRRRMKAWLARNPTKTMEDWQAIVFARTGRVRGSAQVEKLANLARIGRKAKAARALARKEAKNEAYRNQSYAVVVESAAAKCQASPACDGGAVLPPAPRDASSKDGSGAADRSHRPGVVP